MKKFNLKSVLKILKIIFNDTKEYLKSSVFLIPNIFLLMVILSFNLHFFVVTIFLILLFIPGISFLGEYPYRYYIYTYAMVILIFIFGANSVKDKDVTFKNIRTVKNINISEGKYNMNVCGAYNCQIIEEEKIPACNFIVTDEIKDITFFGVDTNLTIKNILICKKDLKKYL